MTFPGFPWWKPVHGGNLSMVETVYGGNRLWCKMWNVSASWHRNSFLKTCVCWKTCVWWKPGYGGNLYMVETVYRVQNYLWWKPFMMQILKFFGTLTAWCVLNKPLYAWNPVYGENLCMVETCVWWKPEYGGNLSIVETVYAAKKLNVLTKRHRTLFLKTYLFWKTCVWCKTCLWWKPGYGGKGMMETRVWWEPAHGGNLSMVPNLKVFSPIDTVICFQKPIYAGKPAFVANLSMLENLCMM